MRCSIHIWWRFSNHPERSSKKPNSIRTSFRQLSASRSNRTSSRKIDWMHSYVALARAYHWIQVCDRENILYMHILQSSLVARDLCALQSITSVLSDHSTDVSVADADAVLILENTKRSNYVNENRLIGFDSQTTFLILSVIETLMISSVKISRCFYVYIFSIILVVGSIPCTVHRAETQQARGIQQMRCSTCDRHKSLCSR